MTSSPMTTTGNDVPPERRLTSAIASSRSWPSSRSTSSESYSTSWSSRYVRVMRQYGQVDSA